MTLNKEQRDGLLEAAKPLMEFLRKNTHPHCEVRVSQYEAELVEGVAMVRDAEAEKRS
jgi:hypothetical protein